MMRAASSSPVAWIWSRHGAIAVMPCLRQASTPSLRPNWWRTVARLIDRPSVFIPSRSRRRSRGSPLSRLRERVGERALVHRAEVRQRRDAEARRLKRAERDRAVADGDAHAAVRGAMIDVAMARQERVSFRLGRAGHAVDIVVTVALH